MDKCDFCYYRYHCPGFIFIGAAGGCPGFVCSENLKQAYFEFLKSSGSPDDK